MDDMVLRPKAQQQNTIEARSMKNEQSAQKSEIESSEVRTKPMVGRRRRKRPRKQRPRARLWSRGGAREDTVPQCNEKYGPKLTARNRIFPYSHSSPSSVSSDCKILLLLLHQLSLARVLVGDVLVGLLVCWFVGLLVCWLSVCWLSVLSQNPGGTRTLSLCHHWWHEDFVLVSPGMAWRLRSLCHLGRVP